MNYFGRPPCQNPRPPMIDGEPSHYNFTNQHVNCRTKHVHKLLTGSGSNMARGKMGSGDDEWGARWVGGCIHFELVEHERSISSGKILTPTSTCVFLAH